MTNYFSKSPEKYEKPYSPIRTGPGFEFYAQNISGLGRAELKYLRAYRVWVGQGWNSPNWHPHIEFT